MADVKLPSWMALFFVAQGFLLALALQVDVSDWGARLSRMAVVGGSVWFVWYRRQLARATV